MKNDVVVLIPHYNDFEGLLKSVKSISREESLDLLIVDDGSSKNKIKEDEIRFNFKANGEVIFLYLKENKGITFALNFGLEYIKEKGYNYVGRLDSGDLCLGNRFKIQVDYLKINPDIKLIGSNIIVNDMEGNFLYKIVVPIDSKRIKDRMYISSSTVIHPSIMFKTEILYSIGNYPSDYQATEDYAFYFKILKQYKISNIDLFLLAKELNPHSISNKNRKIQAYSRLRVIKDNFYFGYYPIYGFVRNYILYLIPNTILNKIKKTIYNIN